MPKLKIKKGDRVVVLRGKDRGREGVVSRALPEEGKVLVDGINLVKKHQKARGTTMQAGIIDKDMPIDASAVAVISPGDGKATKIGYRFEPDGTKVRICKRTGVDIP